MGWTGWSVSAPHQPPPFTWIMWYQPKVAHVVCLSLCAPLLPAGAPAGRKDPLPRLEWFLLGLLSRWRGREEGDAQTWRTLSAPDLPHHPLPHPTLLFSVPSYPPPTCRHTLPAVCVLICVCTRHLSPYGLLCWMHMSGKKGRLCICVCFHIGLLVWLCLEDF